MQILCMRHGHAEGAQGGRDFDRCLSLRGREQVRAVAGVLRDAGVLLDAVWTSPYVRTVQTAELAAGVCGYTGQVLALPALRYDDSPEDAAHALAKLNGAVVLAVGHMPTLPATLGELSRGPSPSDLATSQVVCVENRRCTWTVTADASTPRPWR